MGREQWAIYVAGLKEELRDLAQRLMNRIEQIINRDRMDLLDAIRKTEGRLNGQSERIRDMEDRQRLLLGQNDRIEERLEELAVKVDALAVALAALQAPDEEAVNEH